MVLNKRGQGLSVNAIILIVLGVVVLSVLIFGFTVGFGKILPFISSGNNLESVKTACSTACATNNALGYCTTPREVKIDGETLKVVNEDPNKKATENLVSGNKKSCQALLDYPLLQIQKCSTITCTP